MLLNHADIMETVNMISQQHLDIRTITMGITLLDCADPNPQAAAGKIYDKICRCAQNLVPTGQRIEKELGIPIVNKRISVTPMALVAGASETEDYVPFAIAMDRAARECGVDFIGGFSALVQKGMTVGDKRLIQSIPEALARTNIVCSSVNVGSTKAGINMDAVALMGRVIRRTAALTADQGGMGCAKLVVFCNAVEDNPFMAGATAWASRKPSSTWASPAPAWSTTPSSRSRASPWTWWPRPSRRPPSISPAWASWWPRRPPSASTFPSAW